MIREWVRRRYVEADYRYLEARAGHWWDWEYITRRNRIRKFWERLGGKS